MVDSADADRPCFPLERDLARRVACPDGKVTVRPSRPYEARVHRAWTALTREGELGIHRLSELYDFS